MRLAQGLERNRKEHNRKTRERGRGRGGRGEEGKKEDHGRRRTERRGRIIENLQQKTRNLEQETRKVNGATEGSMVASYLSISSRTRMTAMCSGEGCERSKQSDSQLGKAGSHMVHFL